MICGWTADDYRCSREATSFAATDDGVPLVLCPQCVGLAARAATESGRAFMALPTTRLEVELGSTGIRIRMRAEVTK